MSKRYSGKSFKDSSVKKREIDLNKTHLEHKCKKIK